MRILIVLQDIQDFHSGQGDFQASLLKVLGTHAFGSAINRNNSHLHCEFASINDLTCQRGKGSNLRQISFLFQPVLAVSGAFLGQQHIQQSGRFITGFDS